MGAQAVISARDNLVALGWAWSSSTVAVSSDGGASWVPSDLPDQGGMNPGSHWRLQRLGDRIFVVGGFWSDLDTPETPFIWSSADGGVTFTAAAGVADGLEAGNVRQVFDLGDRLVALGFRSESTDGLRWLSTDGGRSWSVEPVEGIDHANPNEWSAASTASTLWAALDGQLLRSDDGGSTWNEVTDVDSPAAAVHVVDGVLVVDTASAPWISIDKGQTWDELGSSPDGAASLRVGSIDGEAVAGVVDLRPTDNLANDELIHSEDGGSTWSPVELEIDCPSAFQDGSDSGLAVDPPVRNGALLVSVWACEGRAGSRLLVSDDGGESWTRPNRRGTPTSSSPHR